jgi:putative oxidoreductase
MRKWTSNIWIVEIVSAILIFVFVYAGVSKLMDHYAFAAVLSSTPLIKTFATQMSLTLPLVELITAMLVLFPITKKIGFLISIMLMLVFSGYISFMLAFVSNLPCACGGILNTMSWKQHIIFNLFILAIAIIGIYKMKNYKDFIAINRISRTPV